ncbi:MAG: FAD-dependent oxidoreductase [Blastopirellula sp. JB062]
MIDRLNYCERPIRSCLHWLPIFFLFVSSPTICPAANDAPRQVDADLLIVGGTESGCAAAVQAARMGVARIVLVNDIKWLGGQFSAESLGAIDENRAHDYDGTVPIPRSGIFRDVIDAIEEKNAELYGGIRRPGNTRVITTSRPVVSEEVFRRLLAPYEASGRIVRFSNYQLKDVLLNKRRVQGANFTATDDQPPLRVRAKLTIDASDWGDVIQKSGAAWDAGMDAKAEYQEPSAPLSGEPATDFNPITWCMILEEQDEETLLPKPPGYDARYFTGKWGWIDENFAYTSRRLVDGAGFEEIDHPDVLMINTPPIDYPLDVFPADVAAALEATEKGASQKSLVAMTREQREIVFADARNHSLKFYYYLQQSFPKFRRMALSDEFGTPDKLPPKPYVRESLRLKAQHVVREQEVLGVESRSNYATAMFPDAVFSWQFELDFHPTRRSWTTEQGAKGPWEADFRGHRRFGRGGTGRAVFPLRALVPAETAGLLGAQKNLGYTSIVSSSCRLHDQSIHAGQASGAVAAVSLRHKVDPADLFLQKPRLAEIWSGLLNVEDGAPLAIWPFADVDPFDPGFVAVQQLALHRLLTLGPADTSFQPDQPASEAWLKQLLQTIAKAGYAPPKLPPHQLTRREAAIAIWSALADQPTPDWNRQTPEDADADGILDVSDPLPFTAGAASWRPNPARDGKPDVALQRSPNGRAFNFTAQAAEEPAGFQNDIGALYRKERGYGWHRDLTANTRIRPAVRPSLRHGFVFTREQDVWECDLKNGLWNVTVCLGDSSHEQPDQHLWIENEPFAENIDTLAGQHFERTGQVEVNDGQLTLTLGDRQGGSNTCINWLILEPVEPGAK